MKIENYKLIKTNKKEMNDVINFLNYCFNIKFQNVVGKLYKNGNDYSNNHYIIKKDNNIIAAICINESEWIIDDNKIKVAGIGSVCVHPDYRNKGIMQYMLNESNNIIRNLKADISILSGKYDRYNHFGYEKTTQCINYEIPANKNINDDYKFAAIDSLTNNQIEYLAKLNENKSEYIKRVDNEFIESCKQWNHTAYGIFKNDNLIGYIVNKENVIKEIKLQNYKEMVNILYNFINNFGTEKLNVLIPGIEYRQKEILKNFENKLIDKNSQLCQIINYEKVIKILLTYRNRHEKLKKGTLTIKIENYGGIKINVEDEDIVISKYNSNNYDLTLSNIEALKLFLNNNEKLNLKPDIKNICDSWFPLDIYLYVADLI